MTAEIVDGVLFVRLWRWFIRLKSPNARAYFSEREGHDKPLCEVLGWRLFWNKKNG